MKPQDLPPGMMIEKDAGDVMDETGVTMAMLRIQNTGRIAILWINALFNGMIQLTPEMRRGIAKELRHHADALESGELDKLMRMMVGDRQDS